MKSIDLQKSSTVHGLACIGVALALAACGGGQSEVVPAGSAQATPAAAPAPEFTPENFRRVAQTASQALWFALHASVTALQIQELAQGLDASAGLPPAVAGLHRAGSGGLTLSSAGSLDSMPTRLPCALSGDVLLTASAPETVAPGLAPGRAATMERCAVQEGWMVDGRYSWSPEQGSARATADRLGSATTHGEFQRLSISARHGHQDGASPLLYSGHGTLRLSQLRTPLGMREIDVIADMETALAAASGAVAVNIQQFRVYGSMADAAAPSGAHQLRVEGVVSSREFSQAPWQVRTVEPIRVAPLSLAASSGHVILTSQSGGRIHLRVMPGSSSVAVELDANGDGQIEVSVTTPWMARAGTPW